MPENNNRLIKLRDFMNDENLDLIVLGTGAHTFWLLGFCPPADERPCLVCVTHDKVAILMPKLNADGCRALTHFPFFEWADEDGPFNEFKRMIESIGAESAQFVAIDETMRADFAGLVQKSLPNAKFQFTESTVGKSRIIKDNSEYKKLKESALVADKTMKEAQSFIQIGMSEIEIAEFIRASFCKQAGTPLFTTIGSGKNSAIPHHKNDHRTIEFSDVIVMDLGVEINGYASDITRMAVIGEPTQEYKKIHNIVDSATQVALEKLRPGVKAKEIDLAAREFISNHGYGQYFIHRIGHGLGLEVHEPPYLTSTSETILETGMVFSIEPGIYIPSKFGVRLEDIVILRDDGPEILSELTKDVAIIE